MVEEAICNTYEMQNDFSQWGREINIVIGLPCFFSNYNLSWSHLLV